MSTRNQVRTAAKILSGTTGAFLAKEVRAVIATFEQPELQNEKAFPTEDGRWLSIAEVKAHFGPGYANHPIVLEQAISVYAGRMIHLAVQEVGLDVRTLTPQQLAGLYMMTTAAEQDAFKRMTTN